MLQTNGVHTIPEFYSAAELAHMVNDTPTATFASEFRILFNKDLADFPDLVGVW
ncbi:hypothetical protein [Nostoc foliaceum]|uniref:Uncharacterized protein n=1 Tax=Nostoc linckia FACHB-391 TaxID=2692906 RepID=A0ABR8F6M1_NOSLI|nr:hypothetical protein [Nostoc foliaceum]MBD2565848.1 hypothetical protein [Nostoc linckia FACHB-391]